MAPRPSWLVSIQTKLPSVAVSGCSSMPTSAVTSRIAIGSLAPDSISSVACTRSFRRTPLLRSNANTAAASVEPTIAASSMPSRQSTSRSQVANTPSRPAVPITPQLASTAAGRSATRKLLTRVRRPPSSRITESAAWAISEAMKKSSKTMPPGPSSPASMPTPRKSSSSGRPSRAEMVLASTLMNSSRPVSRKSALIPVIRRSGPAAGEGRSEGARGARRWRAPGAETPGREKVPARAAAEVWPWRAIARAGVSAWRRRARVRPRAGRARPANARPSSPSRARDAPRRS